MLDRRTLIASAGATAFATAVHGAASNLRFPKGFLWGTATAGHQIEGNNVNSDCWYLEHVQPTIYSEPSGDADNGFELWAQDLDLVRAMGLNAYRFSLEWARIEPEQGEFSIAMLDHYKRIIEGCRARGLQPMVTFTHFTTPRWFAAQGGWLNSESPRLFARFCQRTTKHLGAQISHAMTMNEPNAGRILRVILPREAYVGQKAMLESAARTLGVKSFSAVNAVAPEDVDRMTKNLIAGHALGRAEIKSIRTNLPVGVTLSMFDDEAVGNPRGRDTARADLYGAWLDGTRGDDFLGVQNYERIMWGENGRMPSPTGLGKNFMGAEIYAPSLEGAVRYAHKASGLPIIVTEHGVGTDDDGLRQRLIPAALKGLHGAIADGVPVKGYVHWSLLDNFEWIFGYKAHYGLFSVDRKTFKRTPKPSVSVYAAIARANAV